MIRYSLRCPDGHSFDSWFQNAAAFDALTAAGRVACPDCGATGVEKAPMAPAVQGTDRDTTPALRQPASTREAALAALRQHVEANSDYVGMNFAAQARAMHDGTLPERPIHGEAKLDEARALIEDGVPVAPLPFMPARKVN
jgi:hypothetical protein